MMSFSSQDFFNPATGGDELENPRRSERRTPERGSGKAARPDRRPTLRPEKDAAEAGILSESDDR